MRTYKPRTPGLRHLRRPVNDHLWRGRPFLALTIPKKGHSLGGRNSTGKITVRHRGGGAKRRLRTVDFFRWAPGPHLVLRIEHDPGRSAHIALVVEQATGMRSYILAAEGMRAGDVVYSFRSGVPARLVEEMGGQIDPGVMAARTTARGNCLPIHMVPVGTQVYNVGNYAGGAGVFCRSAGTYAVVVAKDEESPEEMAAAVAEADAEMKADEADTDTTGIPPSRPKVKTSYVTVRLQSGEVRRVSRHACCTIGVASNPNHQFRQLGKAGRARWLGIRPTVRGVAMNKVDHPHGGGRGKSKGNRIPVSPWGKPVSFIYLHFLLIHPSMRTSVDTLRLQ